MQTSSFQKELEFLIWKWALAEIAISIIAFLIVCWVSYYILKTAIRDGIREAMPRPRFLEPKITSQQTVIPPEAPPGYRWKLVKADDLATQSPPT